ncbi:MAG: arginase [Bacteriovoracaceae bacterium]|nr:arginase [Bacteriovoracaceae bacterium]
MQEAYFIGVPFHAGQSRRGTSLAPKKFRIEQPDFFLSYADLGDVEAPNYLGREAAIHHAQILSESIEKIQIKNKFLAILGGDHGQGLGSVHGLLKHYPDLLVVWIDAHADANIPSASPTGNMHGMPVAWLLGAKESRPWWMNRSLSPKRLIYVGARDLDPYERMLIDELDIAWIKVKDFSDHSWKIKLEQELKRLDPHKNCPLHISLDVDVLDSSIVPSTGTPVPNGLEKRQVEEAIQLLKNNRKIVSTEIVEINPELGTKEEVSELLSWAREIFQIVNPSEKTKSYYSENKSHPPLHNRHVQ